MKKLQKHIFVPEEGLLLQTCMCLPTILSVDLHVLMGLLTCLC